MKTKIETYLKSSFFIMLMISLSSCERDISVDATIASYPSTAEVFIDGFSGGLEYYPYADSKFTAFSVDTETKYLGAASMRFDVPNVDDPEGAYAGAIFRDDNGGRDLSNYDALTFWAKATTAATINDIGFGQDFGENKFQVSKRGLRLTTNWVKYTIPIPIPSKLTKESGMMWFAEGPENGDGYTFWIDELKFEKLGTIGQPRPAIQNGQDIITDSFIGVNVTVADLVQTFNLGSGINETIAIAPSYFEFSSSDSSVAEVSSSGSIQVLSDGLTVISATLDGLDALGSLTINSSGAFVLAPTPERDPDKVTSIFSDYYENTTVDFYNGYWQPYQETLSADFSIDGDHILNYTNFNFVGIQFANPTIDTTVKSNLHFNMYIPGEVPSNFDFLISIVDFGPDQVGGGGDDSREQLFIRRSSRVVANEWMTFEFPLTSGNRSNVGQIIFENINFSSLRNIYLDNIYFYE
ncbi:Ig-like domain-containing protein [Polaribacter litorisediminis]|uniref:Ig-like domain-containing protein n=1 Tax=Polaribacter litorisediminis TaxID=1908341 RepID=UPI001CBC297F|nr:Ig-like domain-containing protein [Polaribacter litorisediminis]UAM99175.1 Ig-like domain-containing protein [Polaribacter litorisediminis]